MYIEYTKLFTFLGGKKYTLKYKIVHFIYKIVLVKCRNLCTLGSGVQCAFILSVVQLFIRTHRSLSCVFIPFKRPGSPSKSICIPKQSQFLDLVCIYNGVVHVCVCVYIPFKFQMSQISFKIHLYSLTKPILGSGVHLYWCCSRRFSANKAWWVSLFWNS